MQSGTKINALDFHPAILGSMSAATIMNYWWHQKQSVVRVAPVHLKSPILHVGICKPL